VLSHLHGDHFGGLPFLLLDAQFLSRRSRPLLIAGPPARARASRVARGVLSPLHRQQMAVLVECCGDRGRPSKRRARTFHHHHGGAALFGRALDRDRAHRWPEALCLFRRYEWVEALLSVADGADLFVTECYGHSGELTGHITWDLLKARLPDLRARRIMVTHMNPTMLARLDECAPPGCIVAEDGLVVDI